MFQKAPRVQQNLDKNVLKCTHALLQAATMAFLNAHATCTEEKRWRLTCPVWCAGYTSISAGCVASSRPRETAKGASDVVKCVSLTRPHQLKALRGEFKLPFPKEGEYFGAQASAHFLDPTPGHAASGGVYSYLGGHFERTLKPLETSKWRGQPIDISKRPKDFHRSVSPLKTRDKLLLMGHVIVR